MNSEKTISARSFLITLPQCEISKEEIKNLLIDKEENLSLYCISKEMHIDESYHIHIFLKYSKEKEFSFNHFDYLGKHPNIQKVKINKISLKNITSYLFKEDNNPLYDPTFIALFLKYNENIAMSHLIEVRNYQIFDFIENHKDFSIEKIQKIKLIIKELAEHNIKKNQKQKIPIYNEKIDEIFNINNIKTENILIYNKLTQNLEESTLKSKVEDEVKFCEIMSKSLKIVNEYGWNRPFKTPNILLYTKNPSKGKTTLINTIAKFYPFYDFPIDFWFPAYDNYTFKLILFNEMTLSSIKISDFNKFFEGSPIDLPVKGTKTCKVDNPLVLCTSNFSLYEMLNDKFGKKNINKSDFYYPIIADRFYEINCDNINLFKYIDALNNLYNEIKKN